MRIPLPIVFLVSGVLFGVSFVLSFLYWCVIPAFILFLYGIANETSFKKLFLYGFLVGSFQYGGSFFWVWSTFPIQWMSSAPYILQLCAIGFYWVLTSCAMGIGSGVFAVAVKRLLPRSYTLLLFVPLLWVLSEIFRSFLFSVYSFGPGSFISIGFSYGYIGYLFAEIPHVAQLSVVGGVYGLSYIGALACVVVYFCLTRVKHKKIVLGVFAVVMLLFYIVPEKPVHTYSAKGLTVITVDTHYDHAFMEHENSGEVKKTEIREAVGKALLLGPDAIVMPEDVRLSDSFASAAELFAWAHELAPHDAIVLVDNGPALDARKEKVLRSYMYDLRTDSVYFFDKRYLVPQGEFISYLHQGILSLVMSEESLQNVLQEARFRPGVLNDAPSYPHHLPGILFCFETMVPYGVKRSEHWREPDFIAHPISHAWFTNPFSLEYQLDSMLKVSAVWNDIPVVSAGSMTESKLFLPSGSVEEGEIVEESARWKLRVFTF